MFYLSCCPYWTNSAASGINPTITTPDTTIARLLMAPCSSLAFNDSAVPMAWEAAPKANPFAIGSSILKILKIIPETTVPKMPAKMTPATMIPATPPINSVVSNAMAIVIERAKVATSEAISENDVAAAVPTKNAQAAESAPKA